MEEKESNGRGWLIAWTFSKLFIFLTLHILMIFGTAYAGALVAISAFALFDNPIRLIGIPAGVIVFLTLRRETKLIFSALITRFLVTEEELELMKQRRP